MGYKELLIKFFSGEITEDEMLKLKYWLESDAENRRIFDHENEIWQEASFYNKLKYYDADEVWTKLSAKLGMGGKGSKKVTLLKKINYRLLIAAACIAFLLSLGVLIAWSSLNRDFMQGKLSSSIIITTDEGDKANILLPDSTLTVLNAKSTLEFNRNFYKDRSIRLTGEAYFDVSTDREKPFEVQTDNMNITAYGTSFNVLSYHDEEQIVTTLEEGEIQVSFTDHEPIKIQPGEQLIYNKKIEEISVNKVNTSLYTSWKENKLQFQDTPLKEVIVRLGKTYNVDIKLMNNSIIDYRYTGTFIDESIEEIMRMLSVVSPISYEIVYRANKNNQKYKNPLIMIW